MSCEIDEDGTKRWYNEDGFLHREDGPAIEWGDGDKEWYRNGKHHRENGPAVEYANGDKEWHKNGKLHSEDDPAIIKADGTKEWYINNTENIIIVKYDAQILDEEKITNLIK